MKWLEIDWIKAHSSIDYDCDDALLELYANSAENALLRTIGRTYDEVVELFGAPDQPVPPDLIHASLMLVDVAYTHRSPEAAGQRHLRDYTFDFLVAPFIKLTTTIDE